MNRITHFLFISSLCLGCASTTNGTSNVFAQERVSTPLPATFHDVDTLLKDHIEKKQIAGATAVVFHRGREVYRQALGFRDVESKMVMTYDSLFRIASMTKPITSAGVMILVDEGKVKLDDPVSKYIPEFADTKVVLPDSVKLSTDYETNAVSADRLITVHDLLTHTSGITYGFLTPPDLETPFRKKGVADGLCEAGHTLEENAKRIAACPLIQQPGTGWRYGLNTDVLGRVIEVASQTSLDRFLQSRIFEPLGMTDTHFSIPESKISRLASLYGSDAEKGVVKTPDGIQTLGAIQYSSGFPLPGKNKNLSGGAGLVSTAADYATFLNMMRNMGKGNGQRILSEQAVVSMTSNQIGSFEIGFKIHGDKFGYGFGIHEQNQEMNGSAKGTYSWAGAFYTYFWVDPQKDIVAVFMTQLFPANNISMWDKFQQAVNASCGNVD